jgi:hypothetical protein
LKEKIVNMLLKEERELNASLRDGDIVWAWDMYKYKVIRVFKEFKDGRYHVYREGDAKGTYPYSSVKLIKKVRAVGVDEKFDYDFVGTCGRYFKVIVVNKDKEFSDIVAQDLEVYSKSPGAKPRKVEDPAIKEQALQIIRRKK